jgi:hypothetical protein
VLVQGVEEGACDGRPVVACEGDDSTDKARFGGSREVLGAVGNDVVGNQGGAEAGGCEEGRGDDLAGAHGDARGKAGGVALQVHYVGEPMAAREMDPPAIG